MNYKHLKFIEIFKLKNGTTIKDIKEKDLEKLRLSRKTRTFEVINNLFETLGIIHWRSGWRCYVMSYQPDIDMSVSCDDELNHFMHELENERKLNLEKSKHGI